MHIIKHNAVCIRCGWPIVEDITEDDTSLSRRDFNGGFDALE